MWSESIGHPIQTTTHRKLALIMGRFTAEDAVKSIQTARRSAELVPVQVCVEHLPLGAGLSVDNCIRCSDPKERAEVTLAFFDLQR